MINKIKSFLFENKNARQTFTKNIFWLASSQVGSRLVRAIIIVYAARVLGASEYGIFSYILGFATFFLPFIDLGINQLWTREVAKGGVRKEYLSTAFWVKIFLLVFSALLIVFVAPYLTNIKAASRLMPLVALLVIFDGLREFGISYLRGLERMEKEALIVIVMNIVITISGFVALYFSPTSLSFLIAYIASSGISVIIPTVLLWDKVRQIGKPDFRLAREILRSGWPIAGTALLGVFMLNTDIVMMGWWRTAEEIGHYSAGQRVAQILYTLPALVSVAVFPTLSRLMKSDDVERRRFLNEKVITTLMLLAIPLTIGGIFLAKPITLFLFGQEYLATVPVFRLFAFTFLLVFPGIFISYAVIAYNKQKQVLPFAAAGSAANVFFDFLFIPRYGGIGSAFATLIAEVISYGLTWRYLKTVDNFHTLRFLKKILIASSIMGIATITMNFMKTHVLINIIASGAIYFGMLYVLKENTLREMRNLFKSVTE